MGGPPDGDPGSRKSPEARYRAGDRPRDRRRRRAGPSRRGASPSSSPAAAWRRWGWWPASSGGDTTSAVVWIDAHGDFNTPEIDPERLLGRHGAGGGLRRAACRSLREGVELQPLRGRRRDPPGRPRLRSAWRPATSAARPHLRPAANGSPRGGRRATSLPAAPRRAGRSTSTSTSTASIPRDAPAVGFPVPDGAPSRRRSCGCREALPRGRRHDLLRRSASTRCAPEEAARDGRRLRAAGRGLRRPARISETAGRGARPSVVDREQVRGGPEATGATQTWNCLKKLSRSLALNSWSVRR